MGWWWWWRREEEGRGEVERKEEERMEEEGEIGLTRRGREKGKGGDGDAAREMGERVPAETGMGRQLNGTGLIFGRDGQLCVCLCEYHQKELPVYR